MEERQLPQLVMRRPKLTDLPEVELPEGYELRSFREGDDASWEAIVERSFGWLRSFREKIRSHFYYRPERVLFISKDDVPVATACAWQEPEWGEECGYLHMVGVDPGHAGRGLGYWISLAALRRMAEDGKRSAVLETDDFRLAAIKTYLKLGFSPDDSGEARLRQRWREAYRRLNVPFGLTVRAFTRPGNPSRLNEDAVVVNARSQIYGVIDGVSAMAPYQDETGRTGGAIAAQMLSEELSGEVNDLREAVLQANARLLRKMEEANVDTAGKWRRWGAVFAIVRWRETHVEYAQSGDCMLLARYKDGSVRVVTRNQVAGFDLRALNAKKQLQESGLTNEEIASRLKPIFKCNRDKANAPDGYSVMNGDPALEYMMESGRLSRAGLAKLYALTDGMFHFIENDEDPNKWEKLLDDLDRLGIEGYMEELIRQEERDPHGSRYPRHKKSDDKSALILEFPETYTVL